MMQSTYDDDCRFWLFDVWRDLDSVRAKHLASVFALKMFDQEVHYRHGRLEAHYASLRHLHVQGNMHRDTVSCAIDELIAAGYLTRSERTKPGGGQATPLYIARRPNQL